MTEHQKAALRIADNRLAELAVWDAKLLALEFKSLLEIDLKAELSCDLAITGFAPPEIDRLVEAVGEKEDAAKDDVMPVLEDNAGPRWRASATCLSWATTGSSAVMRALPSPTRH